MNAPISLSLAALLVTGSLAADVKQSRPSAKSPAKSASQAAGKQVDKMKVEEIKKLFSASGIVGANVEAAKKSIAGMKKNSPGIDEKFWADLENLVTAKAFEGLLIPIYDANFTLDEIKGITKFYQSDPGKAFLKKNNQALVEGGKAFQAFMEAGSKSLMAKRNAAKPAATKKN